MSRKNSVKIIATEHSSGYHFKASSGSESFVISSKHGLCDIKDVCSLRLNDTNDSCQSCLRDIDLSKVKFFRSGIDQNELTPEKIYIFPDRDVVITKVTESAIVPLRIGSLDKKEYCLYGFKGDDYKPGRIPLNLPELEENFCIFNISTDNTPNLEEKNSSYGGLSGALVIEQKKTDFPVAHAVITDNLPNSDLGGAILHTANLAHLNSFFGCTVFHNSAITNIVNSNVYDNFHLIERVKVTERFSISVLAPKERGFPFFNFNKISESLFSKFYYVFGSFKDSVEKSVLASRNIIVRNVELEPVNKLFSSRLTESYLQAPHVYSTAIDDSNYHHMHFMNKPDGSLKLIVSNYCGADDFEQDLTNSFYKMLDNINCYSMNDRLLLERSYLSKEMDPALSESLYEALMDFNNQPITSLCLLYTISLLHYRCPPDTDINKFMVKLVNDASALIDRNYLSKLDYGLEVEIIAVPVNHRTEMSEIFTRLINEG